MKSRQMFASFEEARRVIVESDEQIKQLFFKITKADDGAMFGLDFVAYAVIQRSLSLSAAVVKLAEENNFLSAASLVRLQLDSCLRMHGAWLVDKPHDFARSMLKGNPVKKQKASTGDLLTDQFLVGSLKKEFPWIERVYRECSGFIHLSEKHIYATFQGSFEDGKISLALGSSQSHIGERAVLELLTAFHHITDILIWLLSSVRLKSE